MLSINYDNRKFRSIENSENGEVSGETIFHYHQDGNVVWAEYKGGQIVKGNLIAIADEKGNLEMRYHHLNHKLEFKSGQCVSIPERLPNGKIRLYERWKWTSGEQSSGESIIEEV